MLHYLHTSAFCIPRPTLFLYCFMYSCFCTPSFNLSIYPSILRTASRVSPLPLSHLLSHSTPLFSPTPNSHTPSLSQGGGRSGALACDGSEAAGGGALSHCLGEWVGIFSAQRPLWAEPGGQRRRPAAPRPLPACGAHLRRGKEREGAGG